MLEIIIINNTENLPRPILSISVGFSLAAERIFPLFFVFGQCVLIPQVVAGFLMYTVLSYSILDRHKWGVVILMQYFSLRLRLHSSLPHFLFISNDQNQPSS